ncbi:MAG: geranylgeranylglyceryl/heptaprenylglyceryl phosphate synthase [Flavicella sp.]
MKQETLPFIQKAKKQGKKLLALLLDPDKIQDASSEQLQKTLADPRIDLIFVGGSSVETNATDHFIEGIKTDKPVVLFPGDTTQISDKADALLFLSLLSGDNPEYLIHQQRKAAPILENTNLEIIPTGYILVDGGKETAVQRVSKTKPIAQDDTDKIVHTAMAGVYLGKQLLYLEAGSGALQAIHADIIEKVSTKTNIPVIVGGGIRSKESLRAAYMAGADIVVIGTAFEENVNFLEVLVPQKKPIKSIP